VSKIRQGQHPSSQNAEIEHKIIGKYDAVMKTGENTRKISLPGGWTFEVTQDEAFNVAVRNGLCLPEGTQVTDEHLKVFFQGVVKNTLEELEGAE
jgi:hypothetical protein